MSQVPSLVVLLGLTLCVLPSHKTMAQQFSESSVVYEATRNKIGLIRYCRNNQLLDPTIADQVVTAVETGLRNLPSSDTFATEQGDRAQQAGEEGFWETGRRRDIASVAKLFRTTPADLCQEWADETLRAQAPRRYREVKTITVVPFIQPIQPLPQGEPTPVEPIQVDRPFARATAMVPFIQPIQPLPQAKPTPVEPTQVDRPFAHATAVVRAARSAPPPPPPLPEKAPFLPPEAELASLRDTLPTGGQIASTGGVVSGHISGTTAVTPSAIPQSPGQAVPLSAGLAIAAAGPLPREQTVTEAVPSPRLYDQPQPPREKRLFRRLGKSERCLMPGCRWPTPRERRSQQY